MAVQAKKRPALASVRAEGISCCRAGITTRKQPVRMLHHIVLSRLEMDKIFHGAAVSPIKKRPFTI